ncbi:hypothetical protein I553_10443 [Mycobacterium xenopi 4042]|uniref:Uncharacterized protein n=1 Tax=Mycobacterium xenopi 4042 TaxID=1299334 RepID=X8E6D5_MYCXE|nr:hypothetical protein I553_10443 [Mycobacterium xenopi 4042]
MYTATRSAAQTCWICSSMPSPSSSTYRRAPQDRRDDLHGHVELFGESGCQVGVAIHHFLYSIMERWGSSCPDMAMSSCIA